jgi:hypothetical protein
VGRSEELLRLNVSSSQHKYHLVIDTEQRFLYMSDPANYRIIRIPLTNTKAKMSVIYSFTLNVTTLREPNSAGVGGDLNEIYTV